MTSFYMQSIAATLLAVVPQVSLAETPIPPTEEARKIMEERGAPESGAGTTQTDCAAVSCTPTASLKPWGTHTFLGACRGNVPDGTGQSATCHPDNDSGAVTCTITVYGGGSQKNYAACQCTNWNTVDHKEAEQVIICEDS